MFTGPFSKDIAAIPIPGSGSTLRWRIRIQQSRFFLSKLTLLGLVAVWGLAKAASLISVWIRIHTIKVDSDPAPCFFLPKLLDPDFFCLISPYWDWWPFKDWLKAPHKLLSLDPDLHSERGSGSRNLISFCLNSPYWDWWRCEGWPMQHR